MKKALSLLLMVALFIPVASGLCVSAERTSSAVVDVPSVQTAVHGSDVLISAGKDPSSYHLTWTASVSGEEYVQWVETDRLIKGTMPSDCYVMTATKEAATTCTYTVRGQLRDLESATSYSYRVGSDSIGWSDIYSFDLSDKTDGNFSFILAGDPQIGAGGVDHDTQGWNTTLDHVENWFGDDIDFIMTAGDHVNTHSNLEQYHGFADPEWLRSNVIVGTPGNHDNGVGYSEHFTYTGNDSGSVANGGIYAGDYWIEYEGCLIMSLNLNKNSVTTHSNYMRKAVEEYKAIYGEPTWTIVTFHQSIYSAGVRAEDSGNLDKRDRLAPVFSELGVDAVLSGHDHVYTRAYMINGNTVIDDISRYRFGLGDPYGTYHDPNAGDVLYLTASSSSGSKYYSLYSARVPFAYVASEDNIPTVTKVDISENSMTFVTYYIGTENNIGDTMDFFSIHRKSDNEDITPPVLNVPSQTYYSVDEELDIMQGITAYDNLDKELTSSIKTRGIADGRGATTVTYTVSDAAGNTVTKERKFIPLTETTVISENTTEWRYLDDGVIPGKGWTEEGFDDSAWKTAIGSFGAKNGAIAAIGSYTPKNLLQHYYPEGHANAGDTIPNYFFRCCFDVEEPATINKLYGKVNFDDGCNIYINGVLAAKFNTDAIGEGSGYNADTSSNAEAGYIDITDKSVIDSFNLKEQGNVLAVQLYQTNATSSDVFFRLKNLILSSVNTDPFVTSDGVQMTMHNLFDVKDVFIAEGDRDTYRAVKDNLVVQITGNKLGTSSEYTYTVKKHGIHTVYIKYNDGSHVILKNDVTGAEPTFSVNGLRLTVGNLENVKVIRTAYGEHKTVSSIKKTAGARGFTAKNDIKGADTYKIQYRENGVVTVAVQYNDGYTAFYTYEVAKKTPTVEQNGNTVVFGNLDGLYNIRYAKGEYTTASQIKAAEGSRALKSNAIVDGYITVKLDSGIYTFCVQYDDESFNYYNVTAE